MLVVRPSGAGVINHGSRGEVIDEEVREAEAIEAYSRARGDELPQ